MQFFEIKKGNIKDVARRLLLFDSRILPIRPELLEAVYCG